MHEKLSDNPESWGRYPRCGSESRWLERVDAALPAVTGKKLLPFGLGRSYGDCCLNDGGVLLRTRTLNRILSFDRAKGVLRSEAGVSLDEILKVIVPAGWFLPVSPGTKYITLGGAIANDVHGKNHHVAGTFGCHVNQFELLRSDGQRLLCSKEENPEWFNATIGGLGLTGLITWGEIRLKPIQNAFISLETVKLRNLEDFLEVSAASDSTFEYTVAWFDGLASECNLGRGIFMRGNHAIDPSLNLEVHSDPGLQMPFDAPNFLLNNLSIKAFNFCYYHRQQRAVKKSKTHYNPFFYPLDSIGRWNRIYGKRGFFQYQCLIPFSAGREPVRKILSIISASNQGSFLGVIKTFGSVSSPGLISFPRPGITLALDFSNNGSRTLGLFRNLDRIVREARGRLYPAKDACMRAEDFRSFYPQWEEFGKFIDPAFSSSFVRRVVPGR